VRLICNGTLKEIKEKDIQLRDQLKLLIWSDDQDENGKRDNLIVEATVKYSDADNGWVAQYNERDLKHKSEIVPL
jgi:hypothetical protein